MRNLVNHLSYLSVKSAKHLLLFVLHNCKFKAALIKNFLSTMDQMALFNVKEVAHSDKPTTLQFPVALESFF